jgi:hypothetical protein
MFAFTLLVQKRVSEAQKRVDNARLFDSDTSHAFSHKTCYELHDLGSPSAAPLCFNITQRLRGLQISAVQLSIFMIDFCWDLY